MSLPHKNQYTYYKNAMGTYTIQAPTSMTLQGIDLVFSNDFLASSVADELNKAIKFGAKLIVDFGVLSEAEIKKLREEILSHKF